MSDKCTNCGGQLPPFVQGQTLVQCQYCGHRAQIQMPQPQIQQVVIVRQPQHPANVAPTAGLWRYYLFIPLIALAGPLIAAVSSLRGTSGVGVGGTSLGTGGSEKFQWVHEAPAAAKINGDAIEDFVGHYRVLGSGPSQEFVGGFDGAKLTRIWSAGPFNEGSDVRGFFFAVVGSSVLVTDPKSIGHILDVTTGKETASITMSDRAAAICVEPTGKPEAWIHVSDNEDLDVDFTSKRTKKMARPSWCKSGDMSMSDIHCNVGQFSKMTAHCSDVDQSFKAPNFSGDKMLSDGNVFVVVGEKSPGTGIPTAVGWDPKAKRNLWQRPIPQGSGSQVSDGLGLTDLANGKLISQIQMASGIYKLAALDARTGSELWETEIPRSKDGSEADQMLITPTRVYLPHWTWLDIFDIKTGAVIGTVGQW